MRLKGEKFCRFYLSEKMTKKYSNFNLGIRFLTKKVHLYLKEYILWVLSFAQIHGGHLWPDTNRGSKPNSVDKKNFDILFLSSLPNFLKILLR